MFSKFFKKKQVEETAAEPAPAYPYFESKTELGGTEATTRKRGLENRKQQLESLAARVRPLTDAEAAELKAIDIEITELLETGQGSLRTSSSSSLSDDWVSQGPAMARILLCEDDPDINALLQFLLQHHRFEVVRFNNGKAARDWILANQPPDLISLDIMLPNIDGLELVATIRNRPGWQQVPIIMLTSKSDEPTVQRALQLGANEYLVKPFHPDEYLTRVKRLLAVR